MDHHTSPAMGASRGATVVAVTVTFTVIAVLLVIMRLVTRFIVIRNSGPEDYCIALAGALTIALTALMGEQVKYGLGQHWNTLPMAEFQKSVKPFWYSLWVYYLSLTFTKVSILLQYHRVLVSRKTTLAIWVMMGIVVAYGIATVFDSIFICSPPSHFWDSAEDGTCLNKLLVWFSNAGFNIAIDFAIVLLPMPAIKALALPKRQKVGLVLLFALGGFVCITSIIRLYSLYVISISTDLTWDNVGAAIWSSVEVNVGIMCACLPSLRPLVSRVIPRWWATVQTSTGTGEDPEQRSSAGPRMRARDADPRSLQTPVREFEGQEKSHNNPFSTPPAGGRAGASSPVVYELGDIVEKSNKSVPLSHTSSSDSDTVVGSVSVLRPHEKTFLRM